MPIHIYECKKCGIKDDYLVGAGHQEPSCYNCGADSLERTMNGQTFGARHSPEERPRRTRQENLLGIGIGVSEKGITIMPVIHVTEERHSTENN